MQAGEEFFGAQEDRIARLCHRMAERFARGGRLLAFGRSPAARSDARHVAVEFVHPVIVGKRALPALALGPEGGPLRAQAAAHARPDDIAMVFGTEEGDAEAGAALALCRARGCLTVAWSGAGSEWDFPVAVADPWIRQETAETAYHLLWELVHVFFEHRGLLAGRTERAPQDAGASSFLYPFLAEREHDLDAVLADVRGSVAAKAAEIAALRTATLADNADALLAAAAGLRARLDAGGRVLALGNGGSATDAADAVADLAFPPAGMAERPGLDLTQDSGILSAIANDIGVEAMFARQVIAHGDGGDALLAFTTSGGSANVIAALAEARRRGLLTVAFVGYGGGEIAGGRLADHVVVTRSEHIPRIQEAQASAWHVLRTLIEAEPSPA